MALLGKADWLLRIVTSWPAIYFAFLFSFITHAINNMVGGTLFTYPDNFRAQKAEIAAKYSGAKLTVSKDFKFGETNKSAEFLKKFPLARFRLSKEVTELCSPKAMQLPTTSPTRS